MIQVSWIMTNVECYFKECALDLVFVLSTSSRQASSTWTNIVSFVYQLASRLNIGTGAVQIGVVTYGSTGTDQFFLQDYLLRSTVLQRISNLASVQLTTLNYLTSGLSDAYLQQFVLNRGDRTNVQNVVVVLTSVQSDDSTSNIFAQANTLKNAGTRIYSIGVNSASTSEMQGVSSSPQVLNSNYFMLSQDTQLSGFVDTFYNIICPTVCSGK